MRTAYCFTPDRAFFAAALRAIASLIDAEPDVEREIFLDLRARRCARPASTGCPRVYASASSS